MNTRKPTIQEPIRNRANKDPEVERNKQKDLDLIWKEYDRCVYMIMRALAQMVDLHNDQLQGAMREYDLNNLVYPPPARRLRPL